MHVRVWVNGHAHCLRHGYMTRAHAMCLYLCTCGLAAARTVHNLAHVHVHVHVWVSGRTYCSHVTSVPITTTHASPLQVTPLAF